MKKKKKLLIGIIITSLIIGGFLFFRSGDDNQNYETVEKRELTKEVFESGAVRSGEDLDLSFQTGGTLVSMNVKEDQLVEKGDFLASIDKSDLLLQKKQAEESLQKAKANLQMTLTGSRGEEVESMKGRLKEADEDLDNARESLKQAEKSQKAGLESIYSSTSSVIDDAYILSKNLKDSFLILRSDYFSGFYNQDTYKARDAIKTIEDNYLDLKEISNSISAESDYSQTYSLLTDAKNSYLDLNEAIETVINVSETDYYEDRLSAEDESFLYDSKEKASKTVTSLTSLLGEIESTESSTETKIISAQSTLNSALSRRNELKDKLDISQMASRDEQIQIAYADYQSAKAALSLAENNLQRADLTSPVSGIVKNVHYEKGELISSNTPAVTVTTTDDFYVDLDIYEGDINDISVGDSAVIEFIAFPDKQFEGEVISIKDTGQLINGVVYYQVKVIVNDPPQGLRNEMTGDVSIEVENKEVLSLPRQAVNRSGEESTVKISKDGETVEKEIETGTVDSYGYIEIISGLSEGDRVLID